MNRFSTITIEIESEFDLETVADVWITFAQGKTKITKKKSLREITVTDGVAKVVLEQDETAMFKAYTPIAVQARWVSDEGTTDSSEVDYFSLGDVLEEGEMNV